MQRGRVVGEAVEVAAVLEGGAPPARIRAVLPRAEAEAAGVAVGAGLVATRRDGKRFTLTRGQSSRGLST